MSNEAMITPKGALMIFLAAAGMAFYAYFVFFNEARIEAGEEPIYYPGSYPSE